MILLVAAELIAHAAPAAAVAAPAAVIVQVDAGADPSWASDLREQLALSRIAWTSGASEEARWQLRLDETARRLTLLHRPSAASAWRSSAAFAAFGDRAERRRSVVRAVEALRAGLLAPAPPTAASTPEVAITRAATVSAPLRAAPARSTGWTLSAGAGSQIGGGTVTWAPAVHVGLRGQWRRLVSWGRFAAPVQTERFVEPEGRATLRRFALTLGAGGRFMAAGGWAPALHAGAAVTAAVVRAQGVAAPGYDGHNVMTPSLAGALVMGAELPLTARWRVGAELSGGTTLLESRQTVVGRSLSSSEGLWLGALAELGCFF